MIQGICEMSSRIDMGMVFMLGIAVGLLLGIGAMALTGGAR